MLLVNLIVIYQNRTFRIIDVTHDEIVWIDIYEKNAEPEALDKEWLTELINSNEAKKTKDPFLDFEKLAPSKAQLKTRDKNWTFMQYVDANPLRLQKASWSSLYKYVQTNSEKKVSLKHFYKLLRQYLQRGQSKNSLLPDFHKQGAPNSTRKVTTKKIGRPRVVSTGTGTPITDEIKVIFRKAIDRYYQNVTRMPWSKVHERVLMNFYEKYPNLKDSEEPTVTQLKYFYKKEYQAVESAIKRNDSITYEKDVRPLTSTATAQVLGPGDIFEFDATIIDLYVVDESMQKIIGRPTLLIVIDVFSRMICGYYLTLEPPSYVLAMMSLANCLENKVDHCRKLGVNISEDDWPAIGLPTTVLADKGELLSHQVESLVSTFNVRVANAKARRGDAKGIVEQEFRTLQAAFKPYAPGVVLKETAKKRGGKDYRLDAQLTLSQFEEIIVLLIKKRNLKVMSKYDADDGIPVNLPRTPKDLWAWGINNRSGQLKSYDAHEFKVLTLPRDVATISNEGIKFQSIVYSCTEALKEGWFLRDSHKTRPPKVSIGFDPRNTNNIYIFPDKKSARFWVGNIMDRSREYANITFFEARTMMRLTKLSNDVASKANNRKRLDTETEIQKRIDAAAKRSKLKTQQESDSARLKNISKNKKEEIAKERRTRSVNAPFSTPKFSKPNNVTPLKKPDDYSIPDILDDIYGDEDED